MTTTTPTRERLLRARYAGMAEAADRIAEALRSNEGASEVTIKVIEADRDRWIEKAGDEYAAGLEHVVRPSSED